MTVRWPGVHFSFLQKGTQVGTVFIASTVEDELVRQGQATRADFHGGLDEDGPYAGFILAAKR
jgi:hypothetical protein